MTYYDFISPTETICTVPQAVSTCAFFFGVKHFQSCFARKCTEIASASLCSCFSMSPKTQDLKLSIQGWVVHNASGVIDGADFKNTLIFTISLIV